MPALQLNEDVLGRLDSKVVIVTGGASGIGLCSAQLFLRLGATVFIADRQEPQGEQRQVLDSVRANFVHCDVTDWDSLNKCFQKAQAITGKIDVVCANAGINEAGDAFYGLEEDTEGQPQCPDLKTVRVNLDGAIYTVSRAFHAMKSKGGGSIVLTASMAGYLGLPETPIYAATKHAVVGLMRSLQLTCASHHIAISLVGPGMTPTPILSTLPDVKFPEKYTQADLDNLYNNIRGSDIPANRTETVAMAIAYLATSGLKVNGQGLMVSGDEVRELEGPLLESWPQWILDAMDFIIKSGSSRIYDPRKGW